MKSKIHEYQNKYISMRKNTLTIFITLLITTLSFAQQGINYKAILKDTNGNVLANTFMNVQFTIHQATAAGTIVYQEDHNYTTDTNGLLILTIGTDSSPSVGTFATIDWSADLHFLQTTITYSGGTINFDATQFMAVPYAKHAETAANVFSGDYNDLTNQPTTLPSGLEQITENDGSQDNTGWRLIGVDPNNYGPIGNNATDYSYSSVSFSTSGATGSNSTALGNSTTASGSGSTAMGRNTTASALYSTAMGNSTTASGANSTAMSSSTIASGSNSIAMGYLTRASSYAETVIGTYNTEYTPDNATAWDADDRVFVIGNGSFNGTINRSNALTVLKNGTITAPSFDIAEITDDKALITKEYADANLGSTGLKQITENSNTGWRLTGTGSSYYENIGENAIDLSLPYSTFTHGATGDNSVAVGTGAEASGDNSTAMGVYARALGNYSMAIGTSIEAKSYGETVIGHYNTDYTPNSTTTWSSDDRLFVVGNGTASIMFGVQENNALTVYKNGNSEFDGKIQRPTTGNANLVPIAYGTVESNGNVLSGTGNFTASINANVISISVNSETLNVSNTSCLITPYSTAFRTSSIIISGGDIQVRTFNSSGSLAPTTFQFSIYKL